MADNSGPAGILGVVVGVIVVLALAYFVLGERIGFRGPSSDVNVKIDTPATK